MNKPMLSFDELKLILTEMLNMQHRINQRMQRYIQRVLGGEVQKENQMNTDLKDKLTDLCSFVIAKRLKRNRRNVQMLSKKDLAGLIPSIVESFEKEEDFKFDDEERSIFEKSIKMVFRELLSAASGTQWSYDEYWRRVSVIVEVSRVEGVYYPELFSCDGYVDEVMRGWLSRDEFLMYCKDVTSRLSNIKEMRNVFILPTLESLNITDAKERRKAKRELEAKVTPILEEQLWKIREILPLWMNDEVARIYPIS